MILARTRLKHKIKRYNKILSKNKKYKERFYISIYGNDNDLYITLECIDRESGYINRETRTIYEWLCPGLIDIFVFQNSIDKTFGYKE